jgi:phosphoglycerol transferase
MADLFANDRDLSESHWIRSASLYIVGAMLSVAIVAFLLRLWRTDLTLPFIDRSDAAVTSMCVKSIIENGWYLTNPRLGAPNGMNLCDYPMAENLHFIMMKMLSYLSDDWALVLNLYFLLTFPLTTLSALFVFRRFQCGYFPSLIGSLLFTFLPYHFMRGEIHLFLASYYLVPLMIMLILEVFLDMTVFCPSRPGSGWLSWTGSGARVFICILVASAGVYYAFFGCFLLLVAGLSGCYLRSSLAPLLKSSCLVSVLCLGTVGNLSPTIVYQFQHGRNRQGCSERQPFHADVYGLKPVQLLLPVTDHRLPFFRRVKAAYNRGFQPLVNENDHSSLGLIGGIGFLLMLGRLLYRRPSAARSELLEALAILSLASIFLCTIGGLGSLFSLIVTPMIRGYNRISVYIAYFSFFTIVLTIETISMRLLNVRGGRLLFCPFLLLVLVAGVWDQTTDKFVPPYAWVQDEFNRDEEFIRTIEASLPESALVFQLPYACFPEQGAIYNMVDYDHLRGYLHSKKLKWSYGCPRGRAADTWAKTISSQPTEELLRNIAHAGFSGIYIDRAGFADAGAAVESKLRVILQAQPLVNRDKTLSFFDISEYRLRLASDYENH